jgi:hypothetical protein
MSKQVKIKVTDEQVGRLKAYMEAAQQAQAAFAAAQERFSTYLEALADLAGKSLPGNANLQVSDNLLVMTPMEPPKDG